MAVESCLLNLAFLNIGGCICSGIGRAMAEICFIFYFDKELEISFLNIRLVCLEHSLPRVPSRQLLFHSVTHVDEPLSLSV